MACLSFSIGIIKYWILLKVFFFLFSVYNLPILELQ